MLFRTDIFIANLLKHLRSCQFTGSLPTRAVKNICGKTTLQAG